MTSSIVWASPTSDRDATPGDGRTFPGAPAGDQLADLSELLGFGINRMHVTNSQPPAEQPPSRITRSAALPSLVRFPARPPRQAHFGIRSADPMHLLSTLRTPRYHDTRKTCCWPVCSTLARPDFHRQADTSFPNAPRIRLLHQVMTPKRFKGGGMAGACGATSGRPRRCGERAQGPTRGGPRDRPGQARVSRRHRAAALCLVDSTVFPNGTLKLDFATAGEPKFGNLGDPEEVLERLT